MYLEVTYRRGKPLAAYLYCVSAEEADVASTRRVHPALVADFAKDGSLIGVEIVYPSRITRTELLQVLRELHVTEVTEEELAPIC